MPTDKRMKRVTKSPIVDRVNKLLGEQKTRKQASEANLAAMLGPEDPTAALVMGRKSIHGDWMDQADLAQHLKTVVRGEIEEHNGHFIHYRLLPHQREALEMILVKISRICSGDPNHADHWIDIEGYARLGRQGHETSTP